MSDDPVKYLRGAFIGYDPGGYPDGPKRVIPFRFNPETLSRSLQVQQGRSGSGIEGAARQGGGGGDQGADASSGALKETLSVLVRFDFHDRHEGARVLPAELGIAPEIAALESLLYPAEVPSEHTGDGSESVRARSQRPTVLFVWGRKRVLPVRITGMKVDETLFNAELNPLRAEVEVSLEVLGETDVRNDRAVGDALAFTGSKRRELAQKFHDTTASQGTNILPL